jgi:glycosyltransferase involved in cell wall biosynthesis
MTLQVAYDISNLAADFGRPDAMCGINRVVIELLEKICQLDDLNVSAVALEGDDPLDDSTRAALFLEDSALNCGVEYMFYPGPVVSRNYKAIFRATESTPRDSLSLRRPRALSQRYLRSALHRLAHYRRLAFPKTIFERKSFDVFHCPHWKIPERNLTGDVPRVCTVHDLIPVVRPEFVAKHVPALFQRYLDRIVVERDWVLCVSEFSREEFCERTGMSPERVLVAPNAAAELFHPVTDQRAVDDARARYGIPDGDYLLCLAAPQPRKNLAHLIRSFFRMLDQERFPDIYLVLAGSTGLGWMYDEIFAAAKSSAKHRGRLLFTGYVADADLAALYSGASAFVFPSLHEGFGLPALEAMACGTPVITSNTTSLPEVVGDAALLVDPGDPDELCHAMSTMLSDGALRMRLRQRGLARATHFTWKRCADVTAEVYHRAAAERAMATS